MPEEIKKILEEYKEETKRHFDVAVENIENKIQVVAEYAVANAEKLEAIGDTLEIVKLDIEFIKNDLQQKVSRDKFVFLERRVNKLETKVK